MPKFGYTAGVYGCTGEYFNLFMFDGDDTKQYWFQGMYGADDRVRHALEAKGWRYVYSNIPYGQLKRKDLNRHIVNEYEMLDIIAKDFGASCPACPRVKKSGKPHCGRKDCAAFVKKYITDATV